MPGPSERVSGYGIRVFAEYATMPLWTWGPPTDPHPSLDWFELPQQMVIDFERWNDVWETQLTEDPALDGDDAWATSPAAVEWVAAGYDLCRRLRHHVGPHVEIVYYDYSTSDDVTIQ